MNICVAQSGQVHTDSPRPALKTQWDSGKSGTHCAAKPRLLTGSPGCSCTDSEAKFILEITLARSGLELTADQACLEFTVAHRLPLISLSHTGSHVPTVWYSLAVQGGLHLPLSPKLDLDSREALADLEHTSVFHLYKGYNITYLIG
jgi:hypothetical protein